MTFPMGRYHGEQFHHDRSQRLVDRVNRWVETVTSTFGRYRVTPHERLWSGVTTETARFVQWRRWAEAADSPTAPGHRDGRAAPATGGTCRP